MSRVSWNLSVRDMVLMKERYFTIDRRGAGWAITVHSVGAAPQTMTANSPGEMNRLRVVLSDAGYLGYIRKGADLG